jgi:AraC family transcriptional regulator
MSKPLLRDPPEALRAKPADLQDESPIAERRPADVEMARVLKTTPLRMAADPTSGAITYWEHGALHDVVAPMAEHVIMTHPIGAQRVERRTGKSVAIGTARPGVVTVIPAGSTSRWDIHQPMKVVQLYLPQATLERISVEANMTAPVDLIERTAHPDPTTSRLLMSAAEVLHSREPLDALFRQQTTELLATRLLATHAGSSPTFQPTTGGLSPRALRGAIERLRSDNNADVSLAALASDAGLSRFHFCRAFKESTGLSPHAWLRQRQLEQAVKMLRETDDSIASIAAALGYSSQTAFAAAFRRMTNDTPSNWRRRAR